MSTSCPPFFFCFDLRWNKLTVIHPMNGVDVNYSDYVQPTKDRLINWVSPRFAAVADMMPELFIPPSILKSGEMDTGVYLFHLLEHYKGNKTDCPLIITSVSQLKRYALKLCLRIMTSGDNMLKATVERSAEEWNCVPMYDPFPY
ncbi:uncharacterized protein LOC141656053 [Silene latifolia]|uniref:uncharacterized protein LOC141656053 n=1 Tax=Silene latifolia TaxID=37657 RepID=UPI003D76AFF8